MKKLITLLFVFYCVSAFAQNGITFQIEELSKPEELLYLESPDDIYEELIRKDANLTWGDMRQNNIDFQYNIIAKSKAPDSLVNFGYNSFFNGMYAAYAHHRPFVLSPDMIWLLVSQGFARHVSANSETLKEHFSDASAKNILTVASDKDFLTNAEMWEEIFPMITSQIGQHTGDELINTLTADFSTTTSVEKIASEITIMEAMKPYFEYVVMYIVCGIPEITLLGTTEDWQKVFDKTKNLSKYELQWWTKELEPILKEFVNASKGKIDKKFWRNMFKEHSQEKYGAPNIIDGWIVKFFPYDKDGERNNLKNLESRKTLPEEIVKVDLKYVETDFETTTETMLELWGGFIGLEQNPETFALTPKIGWMIKKKDINDEGAFQKLSLENLPYSKSYLGSIKFNNIETKINTIGKFTGIELKIDEVPVSLKKLDEIYSLSLNFRDSVFIPEWLKDSKIGKFQIQGKITDDAKEKIISWFPNTDLKINGDDYNTGNNSWIVVSGNKIPDNVFQMDEIWVLEILNAERNNDKFIIPDELSNANIQILSILNDTSPENLEKIQRLLPETKLYVNGKKLN